MRRHEAGLAATRSLCTVNATSRLHLAISQSDLLRQRLEVILIVLAIITFEDFLLFAHSQIVSYAVEPELRPRPEYIPMRHHRFDVVL